MAPLYGLGSGARTGVSINVSSPRTKIGSQGRIYAYYVQKGQGEQYKQQLANMIGVQYLPKVNPFSLIFY
jgi:hypothetical protein